jgi:hypothetical protein
MATERTEVCLAVHHQQPDRSPTRVILRRIPDRRNGAERERLLRRLECQFMDMPGLRLNVVQTARLLGVTPEICARVLTTLSERGVLTAGADGCYTLDYQRT